MSVNVIVVQQRLTYKYYNDKKCIKKNSTVCFVMLFDYKEVKLAENLLIFRDISLGLLWMFPGHVPGATVDVSGICLWGYCGCFRDISLGLLWLFPGHVPGASVDVSRICPWGYCGCFRDTSLGLLWMFPGHVSVATVDVSGTCLWVFCGCFRYMSLGLLWMFSGHVPGASVDVHITVNGWMCMNTQIILINIVTFV